MVCALCLTLAGCAPSQDSAKQPPACADLTQAALKSQDFSEDIVELSADRAARMLLLEENQYSVLSMFIDASHATPELAAAVTARDQAAADAVEQAMKDYLESILLQYRDYLPLEAPKIEAAQVLRQGRQLVMVVAPDQARAQAAVKALW